MPGLARLPSWLYPITGWTIGIVGLVVLFGVKVVHEIVVHWREDRRDDQRREGGGGTTADE